MIKHQSKLPNIGTTIFSVMSALANTHNAINLSQGFPGFSSDKKLMDLVTKAMHSGYNQYAPMPGNMELRERIANKFDLLYGTSYNPETEVTITAGATQAIFTIISAFVRQDDEVIIFNNQEMLNHISKVSETIVYETLTAISQRVKKMLKKFIKSI